jgi:hypothetical protein
VTTAGFTVSSPTGAQTIQPTGSATYTISVTPQNGAFTSAITLSATGLPLGATATFSPASITPGSSPATSTLTIQAATTTGSIKDSRWPLALPALGVIGLLFLPGKRRRRLFALCLLTIASLGTIATLSGCGGGSSLQSSQTYTITVSGTGGGQTQTTAVQLTVQ